MRKTLWLFGSCMCVEEGFIGMCLHQVVSQQCHGRFILEDVAHTTHFYTLWEMLGFFTLC